MNSERRVWGYGASALFSLCGSYILLGIALVSSIKAPSDRPCENYSHGAGLASSTEGPMFLVEVMYFIALLLWMFTLYTAGLGQEKDENKFLVSVTYYLSFIPIILAFAYYIVGGVSPFEIVEGLLPPADSFCAYHGEDGW